MGGRGERKVRASESSSKRERGRSGKIGWGGERKGDLCVNALFSSRNFLGFDTVAFCYYLTNNIQL